MKQNSIHTLKRGWDSVFCANISTCFSLKMSRSEGWSRGRPSEWREASWWNWWLICVVDSLQGYPWTPLPAPLPLRRSTSSTPLSPPSSPSSGTHYTPQYCAGKFVYTCMYVYMQYFLMQVETYICVTCVCLDFLLLYLLFFHTLLMI